VARNLCLKVNKWMNNRVWTPIHTYYNIHANLVIFMRHICLNIHIQINMIFFFQLIWTPWVEVLAKPLVTTLTWVNGTFWSFQLVAMNLCWVKSRIEKEKGRDINRELWGTRTQQCNSVKEIKQRFYCWRNNTDIT